MSFASDPRLFRLTVQITESSSSDASRYGSRTYHIPAAGEYLSFRLDPPIGSLSPHRYWPVHPRLLIGSPLPYSRIRICIFLAFQTLLHRLFISQSFSLPFFAIPGRSSLNPSASSSLSIPSRAEASPFPPHLRHRPPHQTSAPLHPWVLASSLNAQRNVPLAQSLLVSPSPFPETSYVHRPFLFIVSDSPVPRQPLAPLLSPKHISRLVYHYVPPPPLPPAVEIPRNNQFSLPFQPTFISTPLSLFSYSEAKRH
ncbi:hypothetical protein IW261DRAFT_1571146 [Armillaria novae-zelandiae]|uniref:Uncharacterized protein n=1 Tax=Armillaria novae-zelandiae TaxID=153914 RepID=A0AA39NVC1_9AGAR|nr:hypothetical protein IW261DRAFT_1571146 [Armillaria novae-zelandiae]